jgi:two-component system response regulator AtoC
VGKPVEPLSTDVVAALRAYDWPGNVRELENTLERALILAPGREITPDLLPFDSVSPALTSVKDDASEGPEDLSIKRRSRELEDRLIRLALGRTGGNRTHAARILELSPRALQYKIKEYAIDPLNPSSRRSDSA